MYPSPHQAAEVYDVYGHDGRMSEPSLDVIRPSEQEALMLKVMMNRAPPPPLQPQMSYHEHVDRELRRTCSYLDSVLDGQERAIQASEALCDDTSEPSAVPASWSDMELSRCLAEEGSVKKLLEFGACHDD